VEIMIIRMYASYKDHWDDGIGFVIIGESKESIDKYMENSIWKEHPYQTFQLIQRNKVYTYYGDVMIAKEIKE